MVFFVSLGGGLENIFCNFYEINSSQDVFLYCKHFGVDGTYMEFSKFCFVCSVNLKAKLFLVLDMGVCPARQTLICSDMKNLYKE